MSQHVSEAVFRCPKCGKRGKWNAAIAGKRVKCPCGTTFTAPSTMEEAMLADSPALQLAAEPDGEPTPPPGKTTKSSANLTKAAASERAVPEKPAAPKPTSKPAPSASAKPTAHLPRPKKTNTAKKGGSIYDLAPVKEHAESDDNTRVGTSESGGPTTGTATPSAAPGAPPTLASFGVKPRKRWDKSDAKQGKVRLMLTIGFVIVALCCAAYGAYRAMH